MQDYPITFAALSFVVLVLALVGCLEFFRKKLPAKTSVSYSKIAFAFLALMIFAAFVFLVLHLAFPATTTEVKTAFSAVACWLPVWAVAKYSRKRSD